MELEIKSIAQPKRILKCFASRQAVDHMIEALSNVYGHLVGHDEGWQAGFAAHRADARVHLTVPAEMLKNAVTRNSEKSDPLNPDTIHFGYGMDVVLTDSDVILHIVADGK